MYHTEQIKGKRILVSEYLEQYVDVAGFLEYCKECEHYGKYWSCPPYDFDPLDYWKKFRYLYVIGTQIIFDKETVARVTEKDAREKYMREVLMDEKKILSDRMRALEKKYPGSISLSAGGNCDICSRCARQISKPCAYPDSVRYSIESLGGNVGKTVSKLLNIELLWMEDKLPEYFTLVNGFLTNDPDVEL